MTSKNGFTIIELMVVVTILAALTIIAAFNYTGVQRQTRDTQRSSSATLIAESLEEYFIKNGEYPSVAKITAADGNSVKSLLDLANTDSLLAPFATPGTTNSWKSGTATKANSLTYNGNTDTSASCTTGSAPTDACDDFKIQYLSEQDDSIVTINSRHTSQLVDVTTVTGIAPPVTPSLTVTLNGANILATASVVQCEPETTPHYSFRSRTNNGSWSGYSTPSTNRTSSTPASVGTIYGYQVRALCDSDASTNASAPSATSAEVSYTYAITAPSTPVLTVTPAADQDSATWSWPAVACQAGTTAQYRTSFYRDDATGWRAYSTSTQTATSITYATNYEGYDYRARVQARCATSAVNSAWTTDSNSPSFIHPVAAVNATSFRWGTASGKTIFTWTEPSCGLGTDLQRRYWGYKAGTQYFANGDTSTGKAATMIFNSTRAGADTFAQWENNAALTPSQLDMTIVNQTAFADASSTGPGWFINVGSPNTNSYNDTSVRGVVQLRCVNTDTGRSATGNYVMSGMLTR